MSSTVRRGQPESGDGSPSDLTLTASEIGEFGFCPQASYLRRSVAQTSRLDFGSPGRFTVYAAAAGIVRFVRSIVGQAVVIDHGHGWQTQYWHLASGSIVVSPGQYVGWSTPIATSSNTGLTNASEHCHLEIRQNTTGVSNGTGLQWDGLDQRLDGSGGRCKLQRLA